MQIKQLEDNIGLPLFEQMGKKIFLTDAGHELNHYSRAISGQLADMELALDELKGLERGKLNISVVSTAKYFAPNLLAKFCQRYSGVTVSLNVSNRETVLKQLADNVTDLAIMGHPPDNQDIAAESFMENPLVVIAPPDHPLCKLRRIPVKRLGQETFLVREPGSGTRGVMERFFAAHQISINRGMETDTNEAIKQAVQAGMGLGIMSLHTAELELLTNRLKVLDVQDFPIIRHWHVVHRKNKRLSSVAQAFREFLLKEAPGLMPGSEEVRG
jgi:DNA-binding transcriptional LysR family regulator